LNFNRGEPPLFPSASAPTLENQVSRVTGNRTVAGVEAVAVGAKAAIQARRVVA
jgi:hypothetical protein